MPSFQALLPPVVMHVLEIPVCMCHLFLLRSASKFIHMHVKQQFAVKWQLTHSWFSFNNWILLCFRLKHTVRLQQSHLTVGLLYLRRFWWNQSRTASMLTPTSINTPLNDSMSPLDTPHAEACSAHVGTSLSLWVLWPCFGGRPRPRRWSNSLANGLEWWHWMKFLSAL